MTEDEAFAAAEHQAHIEEVLQRSGEFLEQVANRQIPTEMWQGPPKEPARAAPQPAPRPVVQRTAMAPPAPSKLMRPVHDDAGRVTEVRSYEGAQMQQLGVWEAWVRREIETVRARERMLIFEGVGEVLGEIMREEDARHEPRLAEIERAVGAIASEARRHAELETAMLKTIDALNDRVRELEARQPPRELPHAAD